MKNENAKSFEFNWKEFECKYDMYLQVGRYRNNSNLFLGLVYYDSDIEVEQDPHNGCYTIDLGDNYLVFGPKEYEDLSGWTIGSWKDGDGPVASRNWENFTDNQVEKEIDNEKDSDIIIKQNEGLIFEIAKLNLRLNSLKELLNHLSDVRNLNSNSM